MITPVLYAGQKQKDVLLDDVRYRTLDSTRNQFKVFDSGVETFSLNSGNSYSWTKTVTHNLGYRPQVLCFSYYVWADESMENIVKVERYTSVPFAYTAYTDPPLASMVASIEKSSTYVKFKFFQQNDFLSPAPANFTLTDMKMTYLVFIDQE